MVSATEAKNDRSEPVRRPRLLLLAYACSPNEGSEEAAGWTGAVQAAEWAETCVIAEAQRYAPAVNRYLRDHGPIPHLHFHFVEKPRWQRLLGRIPGLYYLSYNLWHRRALRVARRLHAQRPFDLVHQLTYCGYREPGYLWKLDAPFVWGPVGGTQNFPRRFLAEVGWHGAVFESLRSAMNFLQLRFSRRVAQAARRARVVMAANSTIERDFAQVHGIRPVVLSDVHVERVLGRPRAAHERGATLRLLWSGRCQHFKGLSLLIKALAALPADVKVELRVLGDGPRRAAWQRLARRCGVTDRIVWLGWRPHHEAVEESRHADLFVFTSLRDTTGTVLVEALAGGLPVVCLDHQGAHDVITPECGIKIPVTTPREVVAGLAAAITQLAHDPELWSRLTAGAVDRAGDFLRQRRLEKMSQILRQALGEQVTIGASACLDVA